jgi:hypothetical protein
MMSLIGDKLVFNYFKNCKNINKPIINGKIQKYTKTINIDKKIEKIQNKFLCSDEEVTIFSAFFVYKSNCNYVNNKSRQKIRKNAILKWSNENFDKQEFEKIVKFN